MSNLQKDTMLARETTVNLEGIYTNWVYIGTFNKDNPNVGAFNDFSCNIDDINEILYIFFEDIAGSDRFEVRNIRTLAQIFLSPIAVNYNYGGIGTWFYGAVANGSGFAVAGSRQRYIMILRRDGQTIEVWFNGALLWTANITTWFPAHWIDTVTMSRSGRWIVIDTDEHVLVFEGQ